MKNQFLNTINVPLSGDLISGQFIQQALASLSMILLVWNLQASDRPNFLFIIADDCTYTDLEVYGGQAKTPHLNKLAQEGMMFSKCFQAAPMCSPTRHCLYTGIYPVKSEHIQTIPL